MLYEGMQQLTLLVVSAATLVLSRDLQPVERKRFSESAVDQLCKGSPVL